MPRYMVHIGGKEFDIELEYRSEKYYAQINDSEIEISSYTIGESRSILIIGGQSLEVDVRANGYDARKTVFIRGQEIAVDIEDYNLARLRKTAGMSSAGAVEKTIKAPMPGLVLDVKVTPGDRIAKNHPVLIVEAMKMENIIKAPIDGIVKAVHVSAGTSVEKGDAMVEFE
ncbi:MAG: acetyl-CoA carboxylase biotin carboxyl carrier protein subunit [Candidatus Zixiibacteriota bacterium]|nr:MAG: acetyl-CoA carboxylase biotin carboxyl carrier protein subunit [candidate division Zixibacteria bacterium]